MKQQQGKTKPQQQKKKERGSRKVLGWGDGEGLRRGRGFGGGAYAQDPCRFWEGWQGQGLGSACLEAASEGGGSGLGLQQAPWGPSTRGEMLDPFLSHPPIPQKSIPISANSLAVSGPLWAWEPLPSPIRPSGMPVLSHLHFSSSPPSLPSPTQSCGGSFYPLRCLRSPTSAW